MSHVTYKIVEHDGGWAYTVDGVFSEPFSTRAAALAAARRAPGQRPARDRRRGQRVVFPRTFENFFPATRDLMRNRCRNGCKPRRSEQATRQ